jgi:hypothetical protein
MIKITKSSDPIEVKQLVVCIHGDPGIGKTSLAFTAEKPLCLAFDAGVYRAGSLRGDCSLVQQWSDVGNLTAADFAGYKTVIVDTAGRALDCLGATLIAEDPKNANRNGGLSLPGFGALKTTFTQWLKNLQYIGLDVVLVCHSDEQRKGDELITRLDMQGASKNEVYKSADMMGSESLERGKRVLNFSPTDTAFGKNPGQLPKLMVPDAGPEFSGFLAKAIAATKAALNKQGAAHVAEKVSQAQWAEKIEKAVTPEDFNGIIGAAMAEGAPKVIGQMIAKAAKGLGFELDKATKTYRDAVAKAAP